MLRRIAHGLQCAVPVQVRRARWPHSAQRRATRPTRSATALMLRVRTRTHAARALPGIVMSHGGSGLGLMDNMLRCSYTEGVDKNGDPIAPVDFVTKRLGCVDREEWCARARALLPCWSQPRVRVRRDRLLCFGCACTYCAGATTRRTTRTCA